MTINFMAVGLFVISMMTNLTVEGIKKLLNELGIRYSSNVLAATMSVIMACAASICYMLATNTTFTIRTGVCVLVLIYLSFLVSTVGYDKVMQTIFQINSTKNSKEISKDTNGGV